MQMSANTNSPEMTESCYCNRILAHSLECQPQGLTDQQTVAPKHRLLSTTAQTTAFSETTRLTGLHRVQRRVRQADLRRTGSFEYCSTGMPPGFCSRGVSGRVKTIQLMSSFWAQSVSIQLKGPWLP
ncbi:hypothetical protein VTG60DRAFT_1440 [Thermothelomyces hinnuleus]